MQRRDRIALQKILEAVDKTIKILSDVSQEEFLEDEVLNLAMGMSIIRVGELIKALSSEIRQENPQVKWRGFTGFRDIAAHRYDTIDMDEVYDTVKNDFPELKSQIEKILESEET